MASLLTSDGRSFTARRVGDSDVFMVHQDHVGRAVASCAWSSDELMFTLNDGSQVSTLHDVLDRVAGTQWAASEMNGRVEVGDFFRSSWGYDQTNVDFYEVLDVSASGKTIKVRQVETATVSENGPSTRVVPVAGSVHRWNPEVLTKHPRSWREGEWAFNVASYANAYLWDGVPAYETAQGWGH